MGTGGRDPGMLRARPVPAPGPLPAGSEGPGGDEPPPFPGPGAVRARRERPGPPGSQHAPLSRPPLRSGHMLGAWGRPGFLPASSAARGLPVPAAPPTWPLRQVHGETARGWNDVGRAAEGRGMGQRDRAGGGGVGPGAAGSGRGQPLRAAVFSSAPRIPSEPRGAAHGLVREPWHGHGVGFRRRIIHRPREGEKRLRDDPARRIPHTPQSLSQSRESLPPSSAPQGMSWTARPRGWWPASCAGT